MDKNFNSLAVRLENKVYGSEKGIIRFQLLQEDILDYYSNFKKGNLKILDAGGGSGRFSRFCALYKHNILLCDISEEMLSLAESENKKLNLGDKIRMKQIDLTEISVETDGLFDMILLHGVAEWMDDPRAAIEHCCSLLKPGGCFSLLVYNTHKYLLKRGYNGRLLTEDKINEKRRKLTPTGRMTHEEITKVLEEYNGEVVLQSGIRIFNNFLKIIEPLPISPEEWLEQERLYYRKQPYASLGEHSHFLWIKK
ncbi:MAG: methyltransferase domain-containing protein [Spirochaetaceae bacterium]|jgi:S-adenosylmethionine-dependent methyltransferase|nr:methyltransferase domain-containing protein [Spirochaetaceae bacterium]